MPNKNATKIRNIAITNIFLIVPALYLGGILGQIFSGNQKLTPEDFETGRTLIYSFWGSIQYAVTHVGGWLGIVAALALLNYCAYWLKRNLFVSNNTHDEERNFDYSDKGAYGTSGWLTEEEKAKVLNEYSSANLTNEIILGTNESGHVITIPNDAKMNRHIAVYGASGTGKSRSFARNYILQIMKRGESLVITDPKGELYGTMAQALRDAGYTVKMLNLVNLNYSDAWNCLREIDGDEVNAQIFADVIIQNTSGKGASNDFWSQCEMNLLKALCLYVERHPALDTTMEEVYRLITTKTPVELDRLFDELPFDEQNQAAKSAYNIYRQAGENVKGGVIIGLGSRLQIFQSKVVCKITNSEEINLTLPGKEKCAYFCITSDQHKAFDFLAVLFYAMLFIKLVNYADLQPGAHCQIPVNFLLDEFPNIGAIPDFTKKISTIRSRWLNVALIFQNIAQLQNRYPFGQWEEILGNCDAHLFLGCTDATTAKFISDRTGIVTIGVSSQSHDARRRLSLVPMEIKQSESIGKRNLLTPDEVLRLPNTQELILLRGQKPLKALKFDYSKHPDAAKLRDCSVTDHIPEWKKREMEAEQLESEKQAELARAKEERARELEEKYENGAAEKEDFSDILKPYIPKPKKAKSTKIKKSEKPQGF